MLLQYDPSTLECFLRDFNNQSLHFKGSWVNMQLQFLASPQVLSAFSCVSSSLTVFLVHLSLL